MAFETTLFVLTLVKFCSLFGQIRKQSIMLVLMKDGTWAFAIIFGALSSYLDAAIKQCVDAEYLQ